MLVKDSNIITEDISISLKDSVLLGLSAKVFSGKSLKWSGAISDVSKIILQDMTKKKTEIVIEMRPCKLEVRRVSVISKCEVRFFSFVDR